MLSLALSHSPTSASRPQTHSYTAIAPTNSHGPQRRVGRGPNGTDGYVVASETCALDLCKAQYVRDVEPGEMIVIDKKTVELGTFSTFKLPSKFGTSQCIFEYVYFARPVRPYPAHTTPVSAPIRLPHIPPQNLACHAVPCCTVLAMPQCLACNCIQLSRIHMLLLHTALPSQRHTRCCLASHQPFDLLCAARIRTRASSAST